jgi:hypothetical protein
MRRRAILGLSGIASKFSDHELMRASLRRSLSK